MLEEKQTCLRNAANARGDFDGFVRVYDWETNNVQINLGLNYKAIVNGTEDPEQQINRVDFIFTRAR